MSEIKLFRMEREGDGFRAKELTGADVPLERKLHNTISSNLESMLGIRLLANEYVTGSNDRGRIDTLGIDSCNGPTIIEYKRSSDRNVIPQVLSYLYWLDDHRAEFESLVRKRLGEPVSDHTDWSKVHLVCVAGDYSPQERKAVRMIQKRIDLVRYRWFDENLLMLDCVHGTIDVLDEKHRSAQLLSESGSRTPNASTVLKRLETVDESTKGVYEALSAQLNGLGDDVREKELKHYVAFKRKQNFASVVRRKTNVLAYLKLNPDDVPLENGFIRDVRGVGHGGTGDVEVTVRDLTDLKRAMPLFRDSYDASGSVPLEDASRTMHHSSTMLKRPKTVDESMKAVCEALRVQLNGLGDDVREKELKHYVAFKRKRNFASIVPRKATVLVYLNIDPDLVQLENGFIRDMRGIGHSGTGNVEVAIRNPRDLERAMPLFRDSYKAN